MKSKIYYTKKRYNSKVPFAKIESQGIDALIKLIVCIVVRIAFEESEQSSVEIKKT